MYMEYKNNLAILQNVLSNPSAYRVSPVSGALNISTSELVIERKKMKDEMELIVDQIDAMYVLSFLLKSLALIPYTRI
jgi:hypothetical protein